MPAPPAPPGPKFGSDWSRRCSDCAWRDICVAAGGCSGGDAAKLTFLARALDGNPALNGLPAMDVFRRGAEAGYALGWYAGAAAAMEDVVGRPGTAAPAPP